MRIKLAEHVAGTEEMNNIQRTQFALKRLKTAAGKPTH